ncbi:hypothetical protein CDG81_04495 [Actinopolyspora erythraea]|uniref:DUF3784 domain-containing protein n=1 Tax=Actinopolyspora erythraea TaxID=414996 RepID=A0A099D234_9ACTN|nr:hypothetical protein [Actinopolyspora erythraea]ASU77692.1 hypothetical protein CDG81_04495 [Actinopolyspora erythraea]KGI80084.1 hypothetical protein IL38_19475 [Actinopolyspora erythraea]
MDPLEVVVLVLLLFGSVLVVVAGLLGWAGWTAVGSWERGTRANRDSGRNLTLLGTMLGAGGSVSVLSVSGSVLWGIVSLLFSAVALVAALGYLVLGLRGRRR